MPYSDFRSYPRSANFGSFQGLPYRRPRRSAPPPTPQNQLHESIDEEEASEYVSSSSASPRSHRSPKPSLRRVSSPLTPIRLEFENPGAATHQNGNYRLSGGRNTVRRSTTTRIGNNSSSGSDDGRRSRNLNPHRHSTGSLRGCINEPPTALQPLDLESSCPLEVSARNPKSENDELPAGKLFEDETYFPHPRVTFLVDKPQNLHCKICFEAPLGLLTSHGETRFDGNHHVDDEKNKHVHGYDHRKPRRGKKPRAACASLASNPTAFLPCGHILCRDCLQNWMAGCATVGIERCCPFCRAGFVHSGCGHDVKTRILELNSIHKLPLTLGHGGRMGHECVECRTERWKVEDGRVYEALKANFKRNRASHDALGTDESLQEMEGARGMLDRHTTFAARQLSTLTEKLW